MSRRRRAFDDAFDLDEADRERAHALQRQHISIGARIREQRLIRNRMRECSVHGTLVEGEAFRASLIEQGKLPYVDPISLDDGIDITDAVLFRNHCVSRTALLRYLDVNRDETRPPRMFDGNAITAREMRRVLGANPALYRFFNADLEPANGAPGENEDDAALARELAEDEAQRQHAGNAMTDGHFRDTYVLPPVSLEVFQQALTTVFSFPASPAVRVQRRFNADEYLTIYELLHAFERSQVDLERRGEAQAAEALMLAKVDYLLTTWRSNLGNRYNIFLNGNREMLEMLQVNYRQSVPVLSRVFTYVESLGAGFRFFNWPAVLHGNMNALLDFVSSLRVLRMLFEGTLADITPEQRPLRLTSVARWRRLVVLPDTTEYEAAMTAYTAVVGRWRTDMTQRLAVIDVIDFLYHFPAALENRAHVRRGSLLWPLMIDPYVPSGERRHIYDAERQDLLYRLATISPGNGDNLIKMRTLLENFRTHDNVPGLAPGLARAYDLGHDRFTFVTHLIAQRQPAMLALIFEINEENVEKGLAVHPYARISLDRRQRILSAIERTSHDEKRRQFENLYDAYLLPPASRLGVPLPLLDDPLQQQQQLPVSVNAAGEPEDEAQQIAFLDAFDEMGE